VLAVSQSLRHELGDKGVTVQAVLPGATATDIWELAGVPVESLPREIVMSADGMVDAALARLEQGEFVTIPALPDLGDWDAFEAARQVLGPRGGVFFSGGPCRGLRLSSCVQGEATQRPGTDGPPP
jgi:short-subunit dehydrogenase